MSDNLCVRCGKPRILAKKWKEKVVIYGLVSIVEHSEMVCPDKKCQCEAEKDMENRRKKSRQIEDDRKAREAVHQGTMVNLRLGRNKKLI